MPFFTLPIAVRPPTMRSVAVAALLGATILAAPLTAALAANGSLQLAQAAPASATAPETKGETVEKRITDLHAALQITAEQETKWNSVAQAMRENAGAMDKLMAASVTTPRQNLSALNDLKNYQKFAQAHVDGLKNLISSFSSLYETMPDAQKKVADAVFDSSERSADTAPAKKS